MNPGWADAIQKILNTNKPKKKKTIILSKAKKYSDISKKEDKEDISFEVESKEEEVPRVKKSESKTCETLRKQRRKKDTNLKVRVKPSITDREREKQLQKIATKGVVQLFNAVKQQQIETSKKLLEAGPLERKREQVLSNIDKRSFLDVLMGETKSIPVDENSKSKKEDDQEKVWSILRDDFTLGAKLKDWDKKGSEEENSSSADEDSDI